MEHLNPSAKTLEIKLEKLKFRERFEIDHTAGVSKNTEGGDGESGETCCHSNTQWQSTDMKI